MQLRFLPVASFDRSTCKDFLHGVLSAVYMEDNDLIGLPTDEHSKAPRSTERAIVARMAIHAEQKVRETFTDQSIVDVEYERIGAGTRHKVAWGRKISPDLIVHERTNVAANYLAVEVKRATVPRKRKWQARADAMAGPDAVDIDKLVYVTHLTALTRNDDQPQVSYQSGVYVELDREGAHTWWLDGDSLANPAGRVTRNDVHYERWPRPQGVSLVCPGPGSSECRQV
jgi:hypothetical protein